MLTSSRRSISYPNTNRSDRPDVPAHIANLVAALELDVLYVQGTNTARIASSHTTNGGLFWWTTDTLQMWYDDGTTWRAVSSTSLDYAQITSNPSAINQTSEGTAVAVITGNSVTYDGSTVMISAFFPACNFDNVSRIATFVFTKDGTALGQSKTYAHSWTAASHQVIFQLLDTPSAAAHTYGIKAYVNTGTVTPQAGAGGSGALVPAFLRVSRA